MSWICVNGEPSTKTSERIWICSALLSPDYSKIQSPSRHDPQSMEPPRSLLLLEKNLQNCSGLVLAIMHKYISDSLGSEKRWSGWIPPRLPPRFPRRLSKSESCCKAFQLGQTGVFPTERLLLPLFPSRWVSLAVADGRSWGSGCAYSAPAPRALKWGTQKHLKWHGTGYQRLWHHPEPHSALTPQCLYYGNHLDWERKCGFLF